MPRVYKRKTDRQSWTQEQLNTAIEAVNKGMTKSTASATYGIPRSTLRRRIASPRREKKMGSKKCVFTEDQENELEEHLFDMESRFYGLHQQDIQKLAFDVAEKNDINNPFNAEKKQAGRAWLDGFRKRHPDVSFRKPEATSVARARGFNRPAVNIFYDLLENTFSATGYPASRVFNADETGVSTVPAKKQKVAAKKGKKQVGSISSAERGENTTVMLCMSASGQHLPPFIIYPRARMNEGLKKDGPPGTRYYCNPSGYMTGDAFIRWFDHFVANVHPTEQDPVLLILDGHFSHTRNLTFLDRAKANFVTVLILPPHTSHRLQPLDVCFMSPFKAHYENASEAFMKKHPSSLIGLYDVAELVCTAFNNTATVKVAIEGFRKTGIYPLDRSVFTEEDFAPSKVTDKPLLASSQQDASGGIDPGAISQITGDAESSAEFSKPSPNSSFTISPSDILPLPKAEATGLKRKRKAGRAMEITTETYRQELAVAEASKKIKSIKASRTSSMGKRQKRQKLQHDPIDILCETCGTRFSDSVDGQGWVKCYKCMEWFHTECDSAQSVGNVCHLCQ